nr:DUF2785 domain-containing protein [Paenibacillus dendritiformis]
MFYRIGSEGDSTVFTRSFSVLPIALILRRHRQKPFLDLAEFQQVKHSLISYVQEEKDLRGYVNEGGWAHSAAHAADALTELVRARSAMLRQSLRFLPQSRECCTTANIFSTRKRMSGSPPSWMR